MIHIIDYGVGNIASVTRAFYRLRIEAKVVSRPDDLRDATHIILPGVGHFERGMANLRELNLIPVLEEKVLAQKTPILGLCLGMHLMTKGSEEGNGAGLGWFDAVTLRFNTGDASLRVPHMGWNSIEKTIEHPLLGGIRDEAFFYFAHSYFVQCGEHGSIIGETRYGITFTSVMARDNIFGVQFHPEKSRRDGLDLLKNFCNIL